MLENSSRTRNEWAEEGSAGSVTTLERERIALKSGLDDQMVGVIYQGLVGSDKFAKELAAAKVTELLAQTFRSCEGHQRITQGRNAADMSAQNTKRAFETNDVTEVSKHGQLRTWLLVI